MKKGDLVIFSEKEGASYNKYGIPEFSTAVVITDPYAAVFTEDLTHAGGMLYSSEKIVVDLLVEDRVVYKCPVELIVRLENTKAILGDEKF